MNRLINGYTVSISDSVSEGFVVPDNQEVGLAVTWWPPYRNCTYLAFVYLYLIILLVFFVSFCTIGSILQNYLQLVLYFYIRVSVTMYWTMQYFSEYMYVHVYN